MKILPCLVITLILPMFAFSQRPSSPFYPASESELGIENARVEQVFKVEDDGYQCISYLVTYHGEKVIVNDLILSTNYVIGDKIYFMVTRHDMSKDRVGGKKLLGFMVR